MPRVATVLTLAAALTLPVPAVAVEATADLALVDDPDCWMIIVTWQPFPVPNVFINKPCVPCLVETQDLCLTRDVITKLEQGIRLRA